MKLFFDTSVLVAAAVKSHEQHGAAFAALQGVVGARNQGHAAGHTLAEMFAVLTRLPVSPRIAPAEAATIIGENIIKRFKIETLQADEYGALVAKLAARGISGGAVYDALLLACAEKCRPDRIYTFNVADFRRIAPHLGRIITAP